MGTDAKEFQGQSNVSEALSGAPVPCLSSFSSSHHSQVLPSLKDLNCQTEKLDLSPKSMGEVVKITFKGFEPWGTYLGVIKITIDLHQGERQFKRKKQWPCGWRGQNIFKQYLSNRRHVQVNRINSKLLCLAFEAVHVFAQKVALSPLLLSLASAILCLSKREAPFHIQSIHSCLCMFTWATLLFTTFFCNSPLCPHSILALFLSPGQMNFHQVAFHDLHNQKEASIPRLTSISLSIHLFQGNVSDKL